MDGIGNLSKIDGREACPSCRSSMKAWCAWLEATPVADEGGNWLEAAAGAADEGAGCARLEAAVGAIDGFGSGCGVCGA